MNISYKSDDGTNWLKLVPPSFTEEELVAFNTTNFIDEDHKNQILENRKAILELKNYDVWEPVDTSIAEELSSIFNQSLPNSVSKESIEIIKTTLIKYDTGYYGSVICRIENEFKTIPIVSNNQNLNNIK